jgi:fructose-1,6-bisphosphatase II
MSEPNVAPSSRNIALELCRVTEFAAIAAAGWIGDGEKKKADGAAVDALHVVLATTPISGTVRSGEGTKDEAPKLYHGEEIGAGGPKLDIAIDPLEGTRLTAEGYPGAIAVIAAAEDGAMYDPGDTLVYCEKVAAKAEYADLLDIDDPIGTVERVAKAKGSAPTVVVLDRDRHEEMIAGIRGVGGKVRRILDGDIAPVLLIADEHNDADLLMGVGGTPETLIGAAVARASGCAMRARFWPRTDEERAAGIAEGHDVTRIFTENDLIHADSEVFFSATGVTKGEILNGVVTRPDGRVVTDSIVLRSSTGTVRRIEGVHNLHKLSALTGR